VLADTEATRDGLCAAEVLSVNEMRLDGLCAAEVLCCAELAAEVLCCAELLPDMETPAVGVKIEERVGVDCADKEFVDESEFLTGTPEEHEYEAGQGTQRPIA
jgi:hypothetical protein